MPAEQLKSLLNNVGLTGLTEDCAVKYLGNDQVLVSNVDIFTPIHDDPVIQGEITACNATNDVFALNVKDIVTYLSFLGIPFDQPQQITEGLLEGQMKFLKRLGVDIDGGHTTYTSWPLMGGIAIGIDNKENLIPKQIKRSVNVGDILLTKPLGLQAAMAVYRVLKEMPEMVADFDPDMLKKAIDLGVEMMTTSNYYVVKTIHEENLKSTIASMTDVTGFGVKVHASEMLEESNMDIMIDKLPIIVGTDKTSEIFGYDLLGGCAAETAGPMLISIDTNIIDSEEVQRLLKKNNVNSWKIGTFGPGSGQVKLKKDLDVIPIEDYNR
ncbi:MAG: selenide, water dikinase SelD [Candidatus Lokiarchaeota archaeon]|nr:selenide, water dikinase SelD [Candidatus Lokiarchaeota archaeon]